MKLNIALGIAAAVGVGAVLFFRTSRGKALLNEWGINFDDLYNQGEEAVKNAFKKAEGVTKNAKEVANAYNG